MGGERGTGRRERLANCHRDLVNKAPLRRVVCHARVFTDTDHVRNLTRLAHMKSTKSGNMAGGGESFRPPIGLEQAASGM